MAIDLSDVSFRYKDEPILESITCHIDRGQFVSITGPNGGGKTTLLKVILGLLVPQRGTVRIDGRPVKEMQSHIGYVPQVSQHDKKFPISVLDVVKTGLLTRRPLLRSSHLVGICLEALEIVDLKEYAYRPFSDLSGGQQQRVLIARALAARPEYLFLDEPTSNVDTVIGEQMHRLLQRLSGERTILLVTHDYSLVSSLSDRVLCINKHLHEHPAEHATDELGNQLYSGRVRRVRHDIVLNEDLCNCGEHSGGKR